MTHRTETTNHQTVGSRLGDVLREMLLGLDALNRFQYDRPWERRERHDEQRPETVAIVKH